MVDRVRVELTSPGGVSPAFPNATYPYYGIPRRTRTLNTQGRNLLLYPIELSGYNEVALRSALFNRTYSLLLSTRRAYICSPITGVAGALGLEPRRTLRSAVLETAAIAAMRRPYVWRSFTDFPADC